MSTEKSGTCDRVSQLHPQDMTFLTHACLNWREQPAAPGEQEKHQAREQLNANIHALQRGKPLPYPAEPASPPVPADEEADMDTINVCRKHYVQFVKGDCDICRLTKASVPAGAAREFEHIWNAISKLESQCARNPSLPKAYGDIVKAAFASARNLEREVAALWEERDALKVQVTKLLGKSHR